jgi:hypothetical protein
MQAEDRPIHFSTELIHAPKPIQVQALQRLYYELSQTRSGAYMNTDFSPNTPPRFHSRRGPKAQSMLLFLPDRMLAVEEWVDIAFRDFIEKVETVISHANRALNMGPIVVQTATIRTTFALTHHDDARAFLLDRVCAQDGRIAPFFQRPVGVGGLRFVFPETPEFRGTLNTTIESYRRSRNEVYVEVKGIFANQRIDGESACTAGENLRTVREFISDSVYPYLAQFDVSTEVSE